MKTIDSTVLGNTRDKISSNVSTDQRSQISNDLILLPLTYSDTFNEHRRKIGILIGRKGRRIRTLEKKYNVRVHVVLDNSSGQLRQKLYQVLQHNGMRYGNNGRTLYVLLDNMDITTSETIVNEIRAKLVEKWNKINNPS